MSFIDVILEQTNQFNVDNQNLIMSISNNIGAQYQPSIDLVWMSLTTYIVFFIQVGFAFLGYVLVGTLWWWWIGYGFAFGTGGNGYIGGWYFCALDFNKSSSFIRFTFAHWLENWAWLCVALTIISGAVAERIRLEGFAVLQFFVSTWVYPIVVSWIWRGKDGWLTARGFSDWSGAVGGYAALAAAIILKPRIGRFVKNVDQTQFAPQDPAMISFGALCLWFGFYGFIPGASKETSGKLVSIIGRCGMNQTLSACTGGITSFIIHAIANWKNENRYSLRSLCNGVIGGIVAMCAIPDSMEPEGAFVTGIMAGFIYQTFSQLLLLFKIDDPCDSFPIHGGCGFLGLVISGILHRNLGVFYGGGAKLLGTQIYGGVCIALWTFLMVGFCLLIVNFLGFLRVSDDQERIGLDETEICTCNKKQSKSVAVEEYYQKVLHTEQNQAQVVTTHHHAQQEEKGLEMNIKQKEDSEYMYNTDQLQFQ